jgi:hypothetical protein
MKRIPDKDKFHIALLQPIDRLMLDRLTPFIYSPRYLQTHSEVYPNINLLDSIVQFFCTNSSYQQFKILLACIKSIHQSNNLPPSKISDIIFDAFQKAISETLNCVNDPSVLTTDDLFASQIQELHTNREWIFSVMNYAITEITTDERKEQKIEFETPNLSLSKVNCSLQTNQRNK